MITTLFSYNVKKRKGPSKGKTITETGYYRTKSLTDTHGRYHSLDKYFDVKTFDGGVFKSHFCEGLPMPMVLGGREITP